MKKKMPVSIKDGLIGIAFGASAIIPGIAGGSVLLITKVYKKVVNAIAHLFSKQFGRNFLTLLPFGIGGLASVILLSIPLNMAVDNIFFSIVCLFAGLILGSMPGVVDNIKGQPKKVPHNLALIFFLLLTTLIGVLSVIFGTNQTISQLFVDRPFYIYFILLGVGFIAAAGLIVPGFSGSMLLLALCFYEPILELFSINNFLENISLLAVFAVGAVVGVVFFSKIMNHYINKHQIGTYYASIGMIAGSLVSIFINSKMFDYLQSEKFGLVDQILGPVLLIVGIVAAYMFVRYLRRHPEIKEDAEN